MVDKGELVGAALTDGPNGKQWLVSVAAVEQVLAARAQKQAAGPLQVRASAPVSALQDELVGLRRQVSELQARTAVAEALAADRQREVERLHESLRVLALTTGDQQPRGHWWNRRKK
jgi:uncharacterized protein YlxW (UPF0749 family)